MINLWTSRLAWCKYEVSLIISYIEHNTGSYTGVYCTFTTATVKDTCDVPPSAANRQVFVRLHECVSKLSLKCNASLSIIHPVVAATS